MSSLLSPFEQVLKAFRAGEMVIMVDHESRENEGDLVIATEHLTESALAFMMREARGLICVSVSAECAERLNLPLQVINNNSPFNTPFTVSVDHRAVAADGVSAAARVFSMKRLIDPGAKPQDFIAPGHIFPLIANERGVLGRRGQTEGSYDLARFAGLAPSGVICEIMNPDGTMARGDTLRAFAEKHKLLVTSVEEVLRYRVEHDTRVRKVTESSLETDFGRFQVSVFVDDVSNKEHLALCYGDLTSDPTRAVLVRLHSECLTGDVFESERCDCGDQLDKSMQRIVSEGAGMVLYLRQEGRGIGLSNKLKAYELQDRGADTVEANIKLGFKPDERDFAVAGKILDCFGIKKIRLLTNNPKKIDALTQHGIEVVERLPIVGDVSEHSAGYIKTKREKLGHWL